MTATTWDTAELARRVDGQVVSGWLLRNAQAAPDEVALRRRDGAGWAELTWAQVLDQAARAAGAFGRLGLAAGDRMLLFLRNRPEFHVADLGAMLCRGTPVSIYNSSAPEQIGFLAAHRDRKSTRLNSSHVEISYAVFCLK